MSLGNAHTENLHRAIQAEKTSYAMTSVRRCIGPRCKRKPSRSTLQFDGASRYCKVCAQDLPK